MRGTFAPSPVGIRAAGERRGFAIQQSRNFPHMRCIFLDYEAGLYNLRNVAVHHNHEQHKKYFKHNNNKATKHIFNPSRITRESAAANRGGLKPDYNL
jgi:hypothetical protein